jgi:hypothetical protein
VHSSYRLPADLKFSPCKIRGGEVPIVRLSCQGIGTKVEEKFPLTRLVFFVEKEV